MSPYFQSIFTYILRLDKEKDCFHDSEYLRSNKQFVIAISKQFMTVINKQFIIVFNKKFMIMYLGTVKLGNKERFDKEQIGIKKPFPVTNLPFTS